MHSVEPPVWLDLGRKSLCFLGMRPGCSQAAVLGICRSSYKRTRYNTNVPNVIFRMYLSSKAPSVYLDSDFTRNPAFYLATSKKRTFLPINLWVPAGDTWPLENQKLRVRRVYESKRPAGRSWRPQAQNGGCRFPPLPPDSLSHPQNSLPRLSLLTENSQT